MNKALFKKRMSGTVLLVISVTFTASIVTAAELILPVAPLITSKTVKPNMMLFLDSSGSMEYIVEDSTEYNASTYSYGCSRKLPNSDTIRIKITNSGAAYFRYNGNNYDFGTYSGNGITGRTQKCFDNSLLYYAELYAASGDSTSTKTTTGYPGALYNGKFLNWYFAPTNGRSNFSSGARKRNHTQNRMEAARSATNTLLDSLDGINVGLSKFDGGNGAKILANFVDVDTGTAKRDLKDSVNLINPGSGGTPLSEAFQELGRYFTLGYSAANNLIIHPDTAAHPVKTSDFFKQLPSYSSSLSAPTQVTTNWCQHNFIVAMTDGQSTNDQDNISSYLQDYDGDCVGESCDAHDKKTTGGYSYQNSGSDYADDIILAMFDIDLRPDLNNAGTAVKNNVTTYLVGFAEEALVNDPLMADMAAAGGGGDFLTAANSSELTIAFANATDSIFAKVAAGSGVAFNTSKLSAESGVYAASYNSAKWSGSLKAFDLDDDGVVDTTASWDAASKLDSKLYSTRNVFSYNSDTDKGIIFNATSIGTALKNDLQAGPNGGADVAQLINYIKGDRSNEGSGSSHYRTRDSVLGDIVNSGVVYVAKPELTWPSFAQNNKFGADGKDYSAFKGTQASRTPMLYVGANDGMLHGFNADKTDTTNLGQEKMAYVPEILASIDENRGLHYLAEKDYAHQFYVDLTPTVSDIFIAGKWRTILVGGLRSGGKGLFALDITDPTKFTASNANAESLVLWEFSHPDFGYSYSKPTVAMMQNGKWAVIVGNGYNNSGDGKAKLFILYIDQGTDDTWTVTSDYKVIDTGIGNPTTPNGLSTPRAVDIDGDGVVDRIYAGDLMGKMWAFDVSNASPSEWDVAYKTDATPKPLFTAKDSSGKAQPITSAPIVAKNTNSPLSNINEPNLLVFFGTGKYIEQTDKNNTDVMSYYSVWDNQSGDKNRSNLTPRKIITSVNKRLISGENIDWENTGGWYFDFVNRSNLADNGSSIGERVISESLIRNNILLFATAIPNVANSDVCTSNSESWLMAIDLNTGKAPDYSIFDTNGDGLMNEGDTTASHDSNADGNVDAATDKVSYSGIKMGGSMIAGDTAILGNNVYANDVDGNLNKVKVNIQSSNKQGRLSWEELIKQ